LGGIFIRLRDGVTSENPNKMNTAYTDPTKKAEHRISAQALLISRIMDTSPDIIHIGNIRTGTQIYINKMLLTELEYSSEDIRLKQLEKNLEQLCHTDDVVTLGEFKKAIALATDDQVIETQLRLKAKNGSWQWIRTVAKIFARDDEGKPEKYIGFSQNITASKIAEEEKKQNAILTELNKAKTEFFSNISHEFKTPLSLILSPLDDLLTNPENQFTPVQVQKLQMVQRNALRLQKLVNTQLDYSRIEAGRMEAVFQPTDLKSFTEDIASSFRSLIENAGLKFVVKCDELDEPVYVSHVMWENIVLNLLSNAFKHTFEGKIEVILRVNKKHIQLHVRDTGIGISEENTTRIFDRYARVEASRSRTYEGTGIGLSLVKDLVNLHGGTIKVNSKPGKGSNFVIVIPKGKAHLPPKQIYEFRDGKVDLLARVYVEEASAWLKASNNLPKGVRKSRQTESNEKPTILFVDDNDDMRLYLTALLTQDYNILTAENAEEAMKLIERDANIALIIADIMMPQVDGLEFVTKLKNDAKTARIPVIILSAKTEEEVKQLALSFDADDFIEKPFFAKALKQRIAVHVAKAISQ
jgi:signal transduction histidine kinase/ActR/RegA family two-component response regulator